MSETKWWPYPTPGEAVERDKFWIVWRLHGGAPTVKHYDKSDAEREAERLAKANPGETFYVLKTTAAAVAAESPVQWADLKRVHIPF